MSRKKARAKPKSVLPAGWLVLGILFAVTLAAYWNSFNVPLVFDDLLTIQKNANLRFGEFSWNVLGSRYILFLLFTLNYLWAGQEVWSYHAVNFLLHLLNGVLVFVLAEHVFRTLDDDQLRCRTYAALASAFFLLHPVQTESVTYISSRSELLSTFFYLAGLLAFVLWPQRRIGFVCSVAVGVIYFFGIGSKETVVTLPASIFLYDFLFVSKAEFRPLLSRWRFYITFVAGAAGAVYFLLTRILRGTIGAGLPGHLTIWQYFLTELRVLVIYIRLVFFPIGLNLDYDVRPSNSPLEPAVIASLLFLGALLALAWVLRRRLPVFAFSILWFFVTLSPTSSVVVIADTIFEHRLYLPMIGICLSFPFFLELVYRKLRERFAIPGTAVAYSCLLLSLCIVGTVMRNYTWGDEVRLWEDAVSKSPQKARPYNALAWAYYKRAQYDRAVDILQKGSDRLPDKGAEFSDTLGNMYLQLGQYEKAVDLFKKALPKFTGESQAIVYNNLGVSYLYMWNNLQAHRAQLRPEEFAAKTEEVLKPATEAFSKALEVEPDMYSALDSYINVLCYRDKSDELETTALERLKQKEDFKNLYIVGKVAFNNAVAATERGNTEEATKDFVKADQYFERAEKLKADEKIVFFNHGYALVSLKQDERAKEKYLQAIRIDPIFIQAHHNLALIYMRQNEYAKAAEAFAEVLRLDPKHVSSNLNLGYIYKTQGKKTLARGHLMTVLEASPGNQQAAAMLQELDTVAR
jgi:tetratricopeptide (TPR) repeat protein